MLNFKPLTPNRLYRAPSNALFGGDGWRGVGGPFRASGSVMTACFGVLELDLLRFRASLGFGIYRASGGFFASGLVGFVVSWSAAFLRCGSQKAETL